MNVAEVNCDENSSLCRQEGIEGYPMLYIYNNGRKVEYRGSRKLEALEKYAKKAVNPYVGPDQFDSVSAMANGLDSIEG